MSARCLVKVARDDLIHPRRSSHLESSHSNKTWVERNIADCSGSDKAPAVPELETWAMMMVGRACSA
jgi:hypothetical protein